MSAANYKMIGLISDTHGYLDPQIDKAFHGAEHILHAGDIGIPQEGDLPIIEALQQIAPTTAVKGNIDGGDLRFLPLEATITIEDFKIGILHIAGDPFRPNPRARAFIHREKLNILLVGHTHIPIVGRVDGCLWINPGAAGREGHHDYSYAMRLHLKKGEEVKLERVDLGLRGKLSAKKS